MRPAPARTGIAAVPDQVLRVVRAVVMLVVVYLPMAVILTVAGGILAVVGLSAGRSGVFGRAVAVGVLVVLILALVVGLADRLGSWPLRDDDGAVQLHGGRDRVASVSIGLEH